MIQKSYNYNVTRGDTVEWSFHFPLTLEDLSEVLAENRRVFFHISVSYIVYHQNLQCALQRIIGGKGKSYAMTF